MRVSDPTRLEVVKNSLEGIAEGMALTLVRTSRSSVVRQSLDFSTGVLSSKGELTGQGMCVPVHLGGMMPALNACLARYPGKVYPGDILATNDPYEGGSHLPDIFLFKPIFERDTLVGYNCAMSHHTDIGGRVAGGNACDSSEIYQEGLRIPPLKLFEEGVANETLFRILEKAVRVPDIVLGDLKGQIAGLYFGEREYLKLVNRYGIEGLEEATEELLEYSEMLTRNAIRSLPDGEWTFTDYIDDDGFSEEPIAIVSTLSKEDDEIHVDFTGTSPQCKGAIQPVFQTTQGMVYAVTKCILGTLGFGDIPNTAGYFRPIKVTAPEGTFLNPLPPAPVAARALGCWRMVQSLFGAFAQMIPEKVYACSGGNELGVGFSGYDKSKTPWKPWVQLEFHVEMAMGGRPGMDGIDAQGAGLGNLANVPVEVEETEQPLFVEEYAILEDSEGAGMNRGGAGMVRQWRFTMDDTVVQVRSDRMKFQPYGLFEGESPAPTKIVINPSDPESELKPSKFLASVKKGDVLRVQWPGGGGWGNPKERDPGLVLDDVIAEKVSVERAEKVYGVVIEPSTRVIDYDKTRKIRK